MGRAVFSQAYATPAPAVIVRTEPEPMVDMCERWTSWSHFDPDSEDFFQDAEYEAFVDPEQLANEEEIATMITDRIVPAMSESSDSSVSDQGSPMAVGSDDPAALIAEAYTNLTARWDDAMEELRPTEPEWRQSSRAPRSASLTVRPPDVPQFYAIRTPRQEQVFIPPPILTDGPIPEAAPASPTVRRAVNIVPVSSLLNPAEGGDRSPSPDSPGPSTPPQQSSFPFRRQAQTMVSPSPPPSVTPRFYSWQRHAIPAIPSSPTLVHPNRDGPLTNPRARMSFARIDSSPSQIRIPNTVM